MGSFGRSSVWTVVQDVTVYHRLTRRALSRGRRGGSPDAVAPDTPAIAASNPNPANIPLAQDVLVQDPPEGLPELPDAVSVDEGVHNGVGVGEDDGDVQHPKMRALAVLTQVVETVDDVQGKPAHSKQTHDDGQRLGGVHLPLQGGTRRAGGCGRFSRSGRVRNLEAHQSELAPRSHEDVSVDDQHGYERHQHAAEEIEIDHVVQGNHAFEQALGHAFRTATTAAAVGGTCGVPSCGTEAGIMFYTAV